MKGIDVSRYQNNIGFGLVRNDGYEFVIMKATQGTSWVDPNFKNNKAKARAVGLLCGYYHFADGGNAKAEARHFMETVGDLQPGELLVLDWEIQHGNPDRWCYDFLKEVEKEKGFKPLIYMNQSTENNVSWNRVVGNDNGLWIARYNANNGQMNDTPPTVTQWPFFAIWQYTSRGRVEGIEGNVDLNYTSMNIETLKKYGYQGGQSCEEKLARVTKELEELKKQKTSILDLIKKLWS